MINFLYQKKNKNIPFRKQEVRGFQTFIINAFSDRNGNRDLVHKHFPVCVHVNENTPNDWQIKKSDIQDRYPNHKNLISNLGRFMPF